MQVSRDWYRRFDALAALGNSRSHNDLMTFFSMGGDVLVI
jgi:hypothetical protein